MIRSHDSHAIMLIDIVLQNRLLLQQNSLLQMPLSALSVMVVLYREIFDAYYAL